MDGWTMTFNTGRHTTQEAPSPSKALALQDSVTLEEEHPWPNSRSLCSSWSPCMFWYYGFYTHGAQNRNVSFEYVHEANVCDEIVCRCIGMLARDLSTAQTPDNPD